MFLSNQANVITSCVFLPFFNIFCLSWRFESDLGIFVSMIKLRKSTPRWIIFVIDITIGVVALGLSYFIRFDATNIPIEEELTVLLQALPIFVLVKVLAEVIFGIHKGLVRYTSFQDSKRILFSTLFSSLILVIASFIRYFVVDEVFLLPTGVIVAEFFTSFFLLIAIRFAIKLWYLESTKEKSDKKKVVIFGAGVSGQITKRTLEKDQSMDQEIVGFIDDDGSLSGKRIDGTPIFHSSDLKKILKLNPDSIIISIQQPVLEHKRKIVDFAIENKIEVLEVPSVKTWINGELSTQQIKQVKIEDLLGRKPIQLDDSILDESIKDKIVLVTGATGSIGSGLVRQIASFKPKKLVLLDQAESPMFELLNEMYSNGYRDSVVDVIGDIRVQGRMKNVFETFKPELVFHAAAYKHVPLMEDNPTEAIKTNVLGTKNLIDLADEYNVERFVFVSTDKAVNPTNVMGASKRIAETYVQAKNKNSQTTFVITRFGNVLGSNGSVIPLFKRQIENGGPLTVTHEDITRYFMTIPEACRLVLEAGAMAKGGEVYVFDMGEPVKIMDLARKMIQLSGLELDKDIEIKVTGLRPGEKLYEELLTKEETTKKTHHPQILIADITYDYNDSYQTDIGELIVRAEHQKNEEMVELMKKLIPEYISNNSVYSKLD